MKVRHPILTLALALVLGSMGLVAALTASGPEETLAQGVPPTASPTAMPDDGTGDDNGEAMPSPTPSTSTSTSDATATPQASDHQLPDGFSFKGAFMSLWAEDQITDIELDVSNTIPYIIPPAELLEPDLYTWDGWPLRDKMTGDISVIDGYVVYIALSAPRTPETGTAFYTISEWRYWYKQQGTDEWERGGLVFEGEEAPLGSRQWAGSARYDRETGKASFYYTPVGDLEPDQAPMYPNEFPQSHPASGRPPVIQQMAIATADVVMDDGVQFENFSEHEIILEADGQLYQTFDDSVTDQVIYGMRDPFHWYDQENDEEYILFTANAAFKPGPQNGVIGIARKVNDGEGGGAGEWELLPPIIGAPEVSSQLERPHVLVKDDLLYVFFTTHTFTFNPEGAGPEGLYGFVTDSGSIRGHYTPLNGTGLVAGNPPIAPNQTYSYLTLPGGYVMSYINTAATETLQLNWVGAPAPMFQIAIDGNQTHISDALTDFGPSELPPPGEDLTTNPTPTPEGTPQSTITPQPTVSPEPGTPEPNGSPTGTPTP